MVKNNHDKEFNDNKLKNLDSVSINRNPGSDNESVNKKFIDDAINKKTIVRFNQTLQNYHKVSVRNDTYNLTKYDKIKITVTTIIISPNTGGYLLQIWVTRCNDNVQW